MKEQKKSQMMTEVITEPFLCKETCFTPKEISGEAMIIRAMKRDGRSDAKPFLSKRKAFMEKKHLLSQSA